MTRREPRGFLLLFAVGTMTLVAGLAAAVTSAIQPDVMTARQRMYLQLGRITADAGLTYAMAVMGHELARPGPPAMPDPGYRFPGPTAPAANQENWPRAYTFRTANGVTDPTVLEATPKRLHIVNPDGQTATAGNAQQFALALWPEPTYQRVREQTSTLGQPTIFRIRVRGEYLFDNGSGLMGGVSVLSQSTIVYSFYWTDQNFYPCSDIRRWDPMMLLIDPDPDRVGNDPAGEGLGPVPFNVH